MVVGKKFLTATTRVTKLGRQFWLKSLLFIIGLIVVSLVFSWAVDNANYLIPAGGTQPGAEMGGDTFSTFNVNVTSCNYIVGSSTIGATLLVPATTNRSLRFEVFQNQSSVYKVFIGSSTRSAGTYLLGESTNTATLPTYSTYCSAAIYGCATGTVTTGAQATVSVIQETQSTEANAPNPANAPGPF